MNFHIDIFGYSVDVPLRKYLLRILILRADSVIVPEHAYLRRTYPDEAEIMVSGNRGFMK